LPALLLVAVGLARGATLPWAFALAPAVLVYACALGLALSLLAVLSAELAPRHPRALLLALVLCPLLFSQAYSAVPSLPGLFSVLLSRLLDAGAALVSELSFDVVSHAELASVSGVLDSGSHVLLGSERDGTSSVVLLAAGLVKPAAGRVLLAGRDPFSSASTRRTIGSLCREERVPTARHAAGAVQLALQARSDRAPR